MKRTKIFFLLLTLCFSFATMAIAQPSAVKKAANATFTLTTFDTKGSILSTTNGVFVSTDGVCVSTWKPFAGAAKAVVIDNNGQKYDVETMLGANEIYDVAKFKVNAKTAAAPFASSATANSTAWVVIPAKAGEPIKASINKVEKFMDKYNYCVLTTSAPEKNNGAPLLNEQGQIVGIYNSNGNLQSATDARYANDFVLVGLSQNDPTLLQSGIRIGLPQQSDEAIIALMLSSNKIESLRTATINDFLQKFPALNNGYTALASLLFSKGNIAEVDKVLQQAISKVKEKNEAHYNYGRMIYQGATMASLANKAKAQGWTLDKAMSEAIEAYKIKPEPVYKHLQAQITYAKGDFQKAYQEFEALTKTPMKNPELYLEMALCQENLKGSDDAILALLNQSIELCDTPYMDTSSPYFLARANQLEKMGKYRDAMKDLYLYEYLNQGTLEADFYYMREQIEIKGKLWQQALQDILIATKLNPAEPMYCAEASNLLLRLNKFEEAILAAKQAIALKDDYAEAYLVLGIAQCKNNQKAEGIANIEKAKSLGNPQADTFLNQFK
ncbi:trypsin-like peptidase domain-containing protein [Prevotella aurantiaca]|uniref:trypsin-like peptidase domain-containing protein n=1 Tax=Prevotella aurantiaca TaxID=596085 RepID=UPI001CAAD96A|nr:trypsin-like peptidase domain-containing protein [Prevotella aurantiaca]MBF1385681.1 serine protease [Prevotella aurantiaca]